MKRLAFVLAALLALPANAGWQKVSSGWVKLSDSGSSGTSTPATCTTAGMVPIFLGSPLALGCDAGLTYDSASDTLSTGVLVVAAGGLARNSMDSWSAGYAAGSGDYGLHLANFASLTWAIGAGASGAADSGLRRVSAGLVGVTDGGSNLGSLQAGNVTAVALGTPVVTVTNEGTAGAATGYYTVTAYLNDGTNSLYAPSHTAASNAALDGTNFNRLTWPAVPGAAYYKVFRYAHTFTPATTGTIYTGTATTFDDTGIAADGNLPPATNTTGRILVGDGSATAPSVAFASDPGSGFYRKSSTYTGIQPSFVGQDSGALAVALGLNFSAAQRLGWSADGNSAGTVDLGLARSSAGTLKVTNGGAGSGDLQAGSFVANDGSSTKLGYSFAGDTLTGFFRKTTGIAVSVDDNALALLTTNKLRMANASTLQWSSGSPWVSNADVGLSRDSAGVLKVTDGGAGAGGIQAAGVTVLTGSRPTADAASRGMLGYVAGGAGVADTLEVCVKSGADTYSWVSLF